MKRRRAELLRRATEIGLLAIVGFLVLSQQSVRQVARQWRRELCTHFLVIAVLYVLYPVRIIAYAWRRTAARKPFWACVRVPASFDPARLIYPTFLPVLVSLSILPGLPGPLLANLVLSLASLPVAAIPQSWSGDGFALHWLLSSLPLLFAKESNVTIKSSGGSNLSPDDVRPRLLQAESAILLFPLHQALLPLLRHLTTTSLLPAELQLLSIALINSLMFSYSPQAVILATLLWVGGLAIYAFLGDAIRVGVALARIPRWRFRRAARTVQRRQNFIDVLKTGFSRSKRITGHQTVPTTDSDADDDETRKRRPSLRIDTFKAELLSSLRSTFLPSDDAEIKSAIESSKPSLPNLANGNSARKRRYTLPNLESSEKRRPSTDTVKRRKKISRASIPRSFLALTPEQAILRKWLYASYVYTGILLLILLPIRWSISRFALNDSEPVGWAIGYLFGNIQPIRFQVFDWGLNNWIPLPPLPEPDVLADRQDLGRAEFYRSIILGEANTRLLICAYCLAVLAAGLAAVLLLTIVEVDTRRKVFHGTMVAMLLPTIFIDPCFISLALALVLAVFLILDLIRASQLPPLSKPIASFLTPYVDGRDLRGPVIVSHIFLLVGCAVPLWLSLASETVGGGPPWRGWTLRQRDVSMLSGVVCVGMGDAAASLIGRRYGRRKWPWAGGKSLEGSAAFVVAVTLGLCAAKLWLWAGQWRQRQAAGPDESMAFKALMSLGKAGVAACVASLTEAVLTGGNDNVLVPIVLWLVVRAVGL